VSAVFLPNEEENIMSTRARNTFIGSFLIATFSTGSYALLALYVVPLSKSLNASIGAVSILFSISGIGGLIAAFFLGSLLKLLKIKKLVTLAGIASLIFYGSMFVANNLRVIYIGALFLSTSIVFGGIGVAQTAITLWYVKNRGKLISYLSIGTGIFGLAVSPVLALTIASFGVKIVALVHGVVVSLVLIISARALISEAPDVYGEKPNGYVEPTGDTVSSTATSADKSLSLKQIMSTPVFWLIIFAAAIFSVAGTGYTTNASAIYQSLGITSLNAAICISVYNAARLGWSPLYGFFSDKFGPGRATLIYGIIGIVSLLAAIFLRGFASAIVIAALFSGGFCCMAIVAPISLPRVFGTKEAGNLIGFAHVATSAGSILGPPLAGFLYDFNGTYNTYLVIAAALTAVVVLIILYATGQGAINKINAKASTSLK
jgi:MFS family permease